MRRPFRLLTCLFFFAALQAGPVLDSIRARGVLRVGITGDYKPFCARSLQGQIIGLDAELASNLAASMGLKLEWVSTSWPTLMQDLEAKRFDLALSGISITPERQKSAFFSIPYLRDGKTPITRCEDQARFQTLAQIDRPGVRVIVNPGGTNECFARAHLQQATLLVFPDNTKIFDEIVARRADLMITDAIETRLQARLHPELCAIHPEAPFDQAEKAILLPRDPELRTAVNRWLEACQSSGACQRATTFWINVPWPSPETPAIQALGQWMDLRLSLMTDVARWKWNRHEPIEDPLREKQVLNGMTKQATAMGIPEAWAQAFFKGQMEAGKEIQRALHLEWKRKGEGVFEQVPDLKGELHPRLDAITILLLQTISESGVAKPEQRVSSGIHLNSSSTWPGPAATALAPLK